MRTLAALGIASLVAAGCGGIGDAQKRVRTAVDAQQPTLNECYGAMLARDATAAGSMELTLRVGESGGRVETVNIKRSDLTDPELQTCVKQALAGVSIQPAPKANLDIGYTLTFTPRA